MGSLTAPASSSLAAGPRATSDAGAREVRALRGVVGAKTSFRLYVERDGSVLDAVLDLDGVGAPSTFRGAVHDGAWHLDEVGVAGAPRQALDLVPAPDGHVEGTLRDAKSGDAQKLHAEPNVPFADPRGFTRAYVGSIGGRLRVRGQLTRTGAELGGSYRYARSTSELTLRGTVDGATGSFQMNETSAGKVTGRLRGYFLTPELVVGTWSTPDGARTMPLVLEGADAYPTATPLVGGGSVAPQEAFTQPSKSCSSSILYPAITGLGTANARTQIRLNALLKTEATEGLSLTAEDCRDATADLPYAIEGSYSATPKKGVLGIDLSGYGFTGGAHGMSWEKCLVLDLAKGERVSMLALFTPTGRATLDGLVQADLRAQHGVRDLTAAGFFDAAPKVGDQTNLCLRPGGVDVEFGDYEIAPHVVGPQEVHLTAAQLRPLLTPGPIVDALLAPSAPSTSAPSSAAPTPAPTTAR